MNAAQHIRNLLGGIAQGAAFLNAGRMRVSGVNILDENGNKWCMRGMNFGEVGLHHVADMATIKAMGGNCVRIILRAWGGGYLGQNSYSFPNLDGASEGSYGDWDPTLLAQLVAFCVAAKAAGLKVIFAFDSNCGQNGNQSGMATGCSLFDGAAWQPGQNLFTALGIAQKLPYHLNRMRIALRVCRGMVDFVECIVEPNPSATGQTQNDVNNFTVQAMNVALAEDPNLIFILGGFSYQHGKATDPFSQGTVWPTNQLVGTCDLLDNTMSDQASGNLLAAINDLLAVRTSKGFPVIVQQAGTQYSSETGAVGSSTDSDLLASGLEMLRNPAGDGSVASVGWCFWEMVGKSLTFGYGPWGDASNDGTGRALVSQNRVNKLSAAMGGTPIFA